MMNHISLDFKVFKCVGVCMCDISRTTKPTHGRQNKGSGAFNLEFTFLLSAFYNTHHAHVSMKKTVDMLPVSHFPLLTWCRLGYSFFVVICVIFCVLSNVLIHGSWIDSKSACHQDSCQVIECVDVSLSSDGAKVWWKKAWKLGLAIDSLTPQHPQTDFVHTFCH